MCFFHRHQLWNFQRQFDIGLQSNHFERETILRTLQHKSLYILSANNANVNNIFFLSLTCHVVTVI